MVAGADLSKGLPTEQEVMEKLALAEAEKASVEAHKHSAAEAEKKELIHKLTKPSGVSDEEALKRVAIHHRTRRSERAYRGSSLSFSQRALHRPRPGHQSAGARLGNDTDRSAQGDLRVLGAAAPSARIQAQGPDRRLFGRHAGRWRHHPEMGMTALPTRIRISPRSSAGL